VFKFFVVLIKGDDVLSLGIIKGRGSPGFEDFGDSFFGKGGAELGLEVCAHVFDPRFEAGVC